MQSTIYISHVRVVDVAKLAKRLRYRGYHTRPTTARGEYCAVIGPSFTLILRTDGRVLILGNERDGAAALEGLVS